MAAIDRASSCVPHPNSQSPPIAHAPNPTGVIRISEFPRTLVSIGFYVSHSLTRANRWDKNFLLAAFGRACARLHLVTNSERSFLLWPAARSLQTNSLH